VKTKKIRIAVCINGNGHWCSAGWSTGDATNEEDLRMTAREGMDGVPSNGPWQVEQLHWIEVEVPIPEESVIPVTVAKVVESEDPVNLEDDFPGDPIKKVTDFPATGTRCSVCGEPQYKTPHGVTCVNGHGGAPPLED
jgi:hypothetical protein